MEVRSLETGVRTNIAAIASGGLFHGRSGGGRLMTNSASTITQTEVDALLRQLQELRQQIAIARETIAPLEANAVYGQF